MLIRIKDYSCRSVNKIRLTLPSSINFKSSDAFNTLNWMHTKSSHNTQTALGSWKDGGHLKSGWQFVRDWASSQFTVTGCCYGPLGWWIALWTVLYIEARTVPDIKVSIYIYLLSYLIQRYYLRSGYRPLNVVIVWCDFCIQSYK